MSVIILSRFEVEMIHIMILLEHDRELIKFKKLNKEKECFDKFIQILFLLRLKQNDQVIVLAKDLLKTIKWAKIYFFGAVALLRAKKNEEAHQICLEGLKIKPSSYMLHVLLAKFFEDANQVEQAIECLKQLISKRPIHQLQYRLALQYQKASQHLLAIEQLTQAHLQIQKRKYFIAKIKSFKELGKLEEALECCDIAISIKPQKPEIYLIKIDLLQKLGRNEEMKATQEKMEKQDNLYTFSYFQQKRDLEIEKTMAIKRQSQIKFKQNQTQSQIILKKKKEAASQYQEAIFYVFTYFLSFQLGQKDEDIFKEMSKYLRDKEGKPVQNFYEMLLESLGSMYPNFNQLSKQDIQSRLLKIYDLKIKKLVQGQNLQQTLHNLFESLVESQEIQEQISNRVTESFTDKIERQKKNQELFLILTTIANSLLQDENKIFQSNSGLLGLEHSLQLIGFMISFPELAQDPEPLEDLVYRLIQQKDLGQFYQTQQKSKLTQEQQQFKTDCIENIKKQSKIQKKQHFDEGLQFMQSYTHQ